MAGGRCQRTNRDGGGEAEDPVVETVISGPAEELDGGIIGREAGASWRTSLETTENRVSDGSRTAEEEEGQGWEV